MISLTPMSTADNQHRVDSADLDHYLARAEQESIALHRATDPRAAASHCVMAKHYSAKAVALLAAAG